MGYRDDSEYNDLNELDGWLADPQDVLYALNHVALKKVSPTWLRAALQRPDVWTHLLAEPCWVFAGERDILAYIMEGTGVVMKWGAEKYRPDQSLGGGYLSYIGRPV